MLIESHHQGQHRSRFQPAFTGAVERTKPAEVAFQVRRGDTLEPSEPGFEPAVMRVGVSNVPGVAHALTGVQVHSLVLYGQFFGRRSHGRRAVRAQHGNALDARFERLAQTGLGHYPRRKSAVAPDRSRATRTGIKSMPRSWRDACPPRLRDLRPVRWPLLERKKKVSSASTTPVSSNAFTGYADCKKR